MADSRPQLPQSWLNQIGSEFQKPYMVALKQFLTEQREKKVLIYPRASEWFSAFHATEFNDIKVVILGQDPYHGPNQAHGLCFSVKEGVKVPPSLQNIFKELNSDLQITPPNTGDLTAWAQQGVLLLNATLTVEAGRAASHQGQGWEPFTDAVVQAINERLESVVFMLWGSSAQRKGEQIDTQKHLVLKAPHPSPLSAHRGFFGCGHFSKANQYLQSRNKETIRW